MKVPPLCLLLLFLLSTSSPAAGEDVAFHAIYTPLRTVRVPDGYEIELAVDLTNLGTAFVHVAASFLGTEELQAQWHVPMGYADLDPQETQRLVRLVRIPEAELRLWQQERLPRLRVEYRGHTFHGVTVTEIVPPAAREDPPL